MRKFASDILWGLALGDALGVPAEFLNREQLKAQPVTDMVGFGTHNQPAGTWSDDSSLAFCLADSLSNGYNLEDIARKMVAWLDSGLWTPYGKVFDIGIRTSHSLNRLAFLIARNETITAIPKHEARRSDNGNGSLMRILPLALSLHKKPTLMRYQVVDEVSSLTHPHVRSVIGCFLYIEYAIALIDGADKYAAYQKMRQSCAEIAVINNEPEAEHYSRILNGEIHKLPELEISGSGYVVHCLEAALWCLLNSNSYAETVLKAVNLGDDTDTTACVAGGLAGLLYGHEQMPPKWIDQIARKEDIAQLANSLQQYYEKRMGV